jgi:hypothetical protein
MPGSVTTDARLSHRRLVFSEARTGDLFECLAIEFLLAGYHWHCERESGHVSLAISDLV